MPPRSYRREKQPSSPQSRKKKITISIDETLLRHIDDRVERKLYNNRSQAIEDLVSSALPRLSLAIFPLMGAYIHFDFDVEGQFILNELEHLLNSGIDEVIIPIDNELIEFRDTMFTYLQKLQREYSHTRIYPLGTITTKGDAGTLAELIRPHYETVLYVHTTVLRGDEKRNTPKLDYLRLYQYHLQMGNPITMVVGDIKQRDPSLCGINPSEAPPFTGGFVKVHGAEVSAIEVNASESSVVNLGVYILEPEILEFLRHYKRTPQEPFLSFTHDSPHSPAIFKQLLAQGRKISAYFYPHRWYHFRRYRSSPPWGTK